jgi:hypothetical protein
MYGKKTYANPYRGNGYSFRANDGEEAGDKKSAECRGVGDAILATILQCSRLA